MSLKHGILGLLNYGPMTGYELMKVFNDSLQFFWNAQTSQIYRELDTLERKGWVSAEHIMQTDKPNKKVFNVTDSGRKELVRWLDDHAVNTMSKVRDEMTMRVFFASNGDREKLVEELIQYKNLNQMFFDNLQNADRASEYHIEYMPNSSEAMYWKMAILRGRYSAEGNIKWVDACLELLRECGE